MKRFKLAFGIAFVFCVLALGVGACGKDTGFGPSASVVVSGAGS